MDQQSQWLDKLLGGTAPRPLKEMAARGQIPFPPQEQLLVLSEFLGDDDEGLRRDAVDTASGMPRGAVMEAASAPDTSPKVLIFLAASFEKDEEILVALAANRGCPDEVFSRLAEAESPGVLESLTRNQQLLRANPDLMAALLGNAHLPAHLRGYLREELERVRHAARAPVEVEEAEEIVGEVVFEEVLTREYDKEDAALGYDKRVEVQNQRRQSIYQMVRRMTVPQKVVLALKGNREARMLLVRDSNKMVAAKVLESPRISDSEIEIIAKMTNVGDEVLRGIAMKREWVTKMPIAKALAMNPKTPVGVSLPLINRFSVRDLQNMARNRNIPEVIRKTADKLFKMRKGARS